MRKREAGSPFNADAEALLQGARQSHDNPSFESLKEFSESSSILGKLLGWLRSGKALITFKRCGYVHNFQSLDR